MPTTTKKKTTKAAKVTTKAKAPVASAASSRSRYSRVLAGQWSGDLMLGTLFSEMLGTFILTGALLLTSGSLIIAGLTVMILVMAMSRLSGAHLNPAVTIALLLTRQVSPLRAGGYIVFQLLGALVAMLVFTQFITTGPVDQMTGETAKAFELPTLTGDWRPYLGEMLGALVFGFGLAAAVLGKKEGIEAGFVVGGSLLVGLLLASVALSPVLNPAVALGLGAYKLGTVGAWTSVWVYALAPIVGVTVGAWLYKLMIWDMTSGKKA